MTEHTPIESPAGRLETVFRDIAETRMSGLPILNPALTVAAVGFRHWHDGWYGVLITPWFMNLIVIPDQTAELAGLGSGTRRTRVLPSGEYAFLSGHEDALGTYWSASLVSPMSQFADMAGAVAVAEAVLETVFKPEANETLVQPEAPPASIQARMEQPVSRRGFFSALLPK
jgi:[NiFe] hydrogenase assembly HybE family chaperone